MGDLSGTSECTRSDTSIRQMLQDHSDVLQTSSTVAEIIMWIILRMTYGSLRFDNMLHMKTSSLTWEEGILYGSA